MGYGSTKALADGSGYRNTIKCGVEIRISTKEIERRARRLRDQMPAIRARAFKTQMKTILGQMKKAMRQGGGVYGVQKFADYEQFTKDLRSATGKNGRMGGRLADDHVFRYDALTPFSSARPKVRIGWLEQMTESALNFQIGKGNSTDPFTVANNRHYWHKVLATETLPSAYVHKERQLIVPFERHVHENLQKWIDGYVKKTLAHQIAKEMRKAS